MHVSSLANTQIVIPSAIQIVAYPFGHHPSQRNALFVALYFLFI